MSSRCDVTRHSRTLSVFHFADLMTDCTHIKKYRFYTDALNIEYFAEDKLKANKKRLQHSFVFLLTLWHNKLMWAPFNVIKLSRFTSHKIYLLYIMYLSSSFSYFSYSVIDLVQSDPINSLYYIQLATGKIIIFKTNWKSNFNFSILLSSF